MFYNRKAVASSVYKTISPEETQKIAESLAKKYRKGGIFLLSGPLGAGKTTFVQGFAKGLGITHPIISPTFILIREYDIPQNPQGKLFHIDLYRLDNPQQLATLGLEEIFSNCANIVLIEWAEKLERLSPKKAIRIEIKHLKNTQRKILVEE